MIRFFLFLTVLIGGLHVRASKAVDGYTFYLPLVYQQPYPCGVEVWRDFNYTDQLSDLNCRYTRYNPGTVNSPNLYRTWLMSDKNWNSLAFAVTDIAKIRAAGSEPVVVFFGNQAGTCTRLSALRYQEFANFVREAVSRWDLKYIEIWNEPDYLGGHPNLYGCWGIEYTAAFVQFLQTVTETVWNIYPQVKIGTSFALSSTATLPMPEAVAQAYQDEPRFFIGIHHHSVYQQTNTQQASEKLADVREFWNGELWLTEVSLRKSSQDVYCHDPTSDFQQAQADFVGDIMQVEADAVIVYGLFKYSESWQCAALLQNDGSPNLAYYALQMEYVP